MKNLWVSMERPFATWRADLSPSRDSRAALGFVKVVLAAGARHDVFAVADAPDLDAVFAAGELDWFAFLGGAMMPGRSHGPATLARLAYFDREGAIAEAPVDDVGALLESVQPGYGGFRQHYPPVRVQGWAKRYPVGRLDSRLALVARFELHSDIWFPWVHGSAHERRESGSCFDNRELVARHTPRLNAFFEEVALAALELGGTFELDRERDSTGTKQLEMATDSGISIDAPPTGPVLDAEPYDLEF